MRLKSVAAVLLLVAFVLPQYTCTDWVDRDGKGVGAVQPTGDSASMYHKVETHHYAYESFVASDWTSYVIVLTFTWPAVMLLVGRGVRRRGARIALTIVEILLAIGSGYLIYIFSDNGARASGAYLGLGANILYLFGLLPWRSRTTDPAPSSPP